MKCLDLHADDASGQLKLENWLFVFLLKKWCSFHYFICTLGEEASCYCLLKRGSIILLGNLGRRLLNLLKLLSKSILAVMLARVSFTVYALPRALVVYIKLFYVSPYCYLYSCICSICCDTFIFTVLLLVNPVYLSITSARVKSSITIQSVYSCWGVLSIFSFCYLNGAFCILCKSGWLYNRQINVTFK